MSKIHEVIVTSTDDDPAGRGVAQEARRTLGIDNLTAVRTAKVYRLEGTTESEAEALAVKLLSDPVTESFKLDTKPNDDPDTVEVAYQPGVMNPAAASILKAAADIGIDLTAADSSTRYTFEGNISPAQVDAIVGGLLVNKIVQHVVTEPPESLRFEGQVGPVKTVPIINAMPEQLNELSAGKLFLDLQEMKVIQEYFRSQGREPTDCELEIIAGRWSEHCGHKTFNGEVVVDGVVKPPLFTRIREAAKEHFGDLVISAFGDNSGVIRFYDGQAICGKVETHNSPSAVEPYGGAMTGSGGVFRDIAGTGQGAKNIISTDMFCFAPPDLDPSKLPPGTLRPDYLQRRVVQGVCDYGNRMGIPTANGSVHYHEDFRAKPSVIVGAYGIMPEIRARKGEPQLGDLVVAIGGRTGRDGIHGATFSSGEMTDNTAQINSSAVQIGNAIEEKRMFDALLEARDLDYIRAITDCGAAGFSSAIGELGEDIGATVDLAKVPLKYPGLAPWEIWMSESQERMVAAIAPENVDSFIATCAKYNVEAAVLGEFDGSHSLTVNYGQQNVAELDYEFLKNGLPQRVMTAHWERPLVGEKKPPRPTSAIEWYWRVHDVLTHGNVASKEAIVRQYDHGVQGGNVVPPFGGTTQQGPNDALVVRPLLDKPYGVVQSHGMNPILNRLDPYEGTRWAIAEAAANYVSAGGNIAEAALVGNFIWPFPDSQAMGSLDLSVDASVDMMHLLEVPVISGKDSLSSTYRRRNEQDEVVEVIEIPPVYCASMFGRIPDVEKTMTTDIKKPGSTLVLVGELSQNMGGSAYYDVAEGSSAHVPLVDTENLPKILEIVQTSIASGKVLACHDISEGGMITAIGEMCFGGDCGADIKLPADQDPEVMLFSETAGCFVIEVGDEAQAEELFAGVPHAVVGRTTYKKANDTNLISVSHDKPLFYASTEALKNAWQKPLQEIFQ